MGFALKTYAVCYPDFYDLIYLGETCEKVACLHLPGVVGDGIKVRGEDGLKRFDELLAPLRWLSSGCC